MWRVVGNEQAQSLETGCIQHQLDREHFFGSSLYCS